MKGMQLLLNHGIFNIFLSAAMPFLQSYLYEVVRMDVSAMSLPCYPLCHHYLSPQLSKVSLLQFLTTALSVSLAHSFEAVIRLKNSNLPQNNSISSPPLEIRRGDFLKQSLAYRKLLGNVPPDVGAFPGQTVWRSFNYLIPLDGLPFLLLHKAITLILHGALNAYSWC